ncbi:MAG: glycosyltransferase family 39 protein [Planctomycetaceae bacterium]|jgi:4-amino-4-deoxy-L-arabinose transferase-like glycosyltransferase|nr:glycosyltransferase family 39 protein [Planctomycetaceae bacterium]
MTFDESRVRICILCSLLFIQTLFLILLSYQTSLNRTEVGHVGAAVYFNRTLRYDVFHVNPPLTRYIVGLPIFLTKPDYDWRSYSPQPEDRSEWSIGYAFIKVNTSEKIHWCVFLARCSLIPVILLGSWFGYKFALELYGKNAGLIFLMLWIFSPLVLAWGATICPDVCAASLGIIGIYTFWHWLKKPTCKAAIIAGICLGILPLAKITWVIAFPLWMLIWLFWILTVFIPRKKSDKKIILPGCKQLLAILFIGLYTLNMGYVFDGTLRPLNEYKFISHTLTGTKFQNSDYTPTSHNRFERSILGNVPIPLPAEFVQGIDTQKFDFEHGMESYIRGQYSQHGWWYYYVYIILIKEPLGNLCLGLLALITTIFIRKYNASWRDEMIIILPGLLFFIFVSSQTGFSLHPRYIVPALPFAYIWIAKLGQSFFDKRIVSVAVTLLLVWMIGSSFYHFPHSMSYFNELISDAKNLPKHLLGSNIDWGQNSYFLQKWYHKHHEARPIKIDYSSAESLDRLGIKENTRPTGKPESGWFAIGVNELYAQSKQYEYFKRLDPVDMIGCSIYIYHITSSDANRLRHETMPQKAESEVSDR